MGYKADLPRSKVVFEHFFTAKSGNLSSKVRFCFFRMIQILTRLENEVAESNLIVEIIPGSLFLLVEVSISFLSSFVDSTLQLLLFGVMSSYITLIYSEL